MAARQFSWMMLTILLCSVALPIAGSASDVQRPVHTYSIVARDSVSGEMGVAVQSHWFSVGSVVSWGEAGVGVVATQSLAEISYGPLGLELMRAGKSASQALNALLEADEHPEWRQVAMVDARGNVAVHTGDNCIAEAGHHVGAQYSVQANLMEKNSVWSAMAHAYENATGSLADRMLAALEAAQGEGGDIRGKQSAAMLIVKPNSSGRPYADKVIDLRIEDHPEPVVELRRLVMLNQAYNRMNLGDEYVAAGDIKSALDAYSGALALAPGITELKFWAAVTMFSQGSEQEALAYFKDVFTADVRWVTVVRRLPAAGLLPDDDSLIEKIVSVAP